MKIQPIPTTGKLPVEYTPLPQDVAALVQRQTPELRRLEKAAEEAIAEHGPDSDHAVVAQNEVVEMRDVIDEIRDRIPKKYPTPMVFLIRVPTSVEREQINSRLISLGLTQVTQEQVRATMIEELFVQDWGKGSAEANEAEAEYLANFCDSYWLRQEAHDASISRWQEQEVERVMDESEGAPVRDSVEMPAKLISVREQAKMTLLIDRMMTSSQKMRDLAARGADYTRLNAMLLVRAHVISATGVTTLLEPDRYTKALPEDQAVALREEVDDASWVDLVAFIDRMYQLDGGEVKNSDSPLGKQSDPTGSPAPIGDMATSGGSSTISSTTPVPDGVSETIIEPLSASTSDSDPVPEPERESVSLTGLAC